MIDRILQHSGWRRRAELIGLITALCLVLGTATGFTVFLVQVQGAATAYMVGQSKWSRAQLGTVFALYRYADHGNPADLESARSQMDILLGDMQARRAMDAEALDYEVAREGLLRGDNHPDDVAGMIWLYRYFSELPHLKEAAEVWRESDDYVLELAALAEELEAAWADGAPGDQQRQALLNRLEMVNARNYALTTRFIHGFADASRWMRKTLTVAAILTMTLLGLMAALLSWRLTRVVNASKKRFRAIFEQAAVGIAELSTDRYFVSVNSALCNMLGYSREDLLEKRFDQVAHEEDVDVGLEQGQKLLAGDGEAVTLEQRFVRADGGIVWGKLTLSAVAAAKGRDASFIAVCEDVSESRRLSIELKYQAAHDSLTGLLNRRAFERNLAHALRTVREGGSDHALCFVDLDQFKVVNDTCGHAAGDAMLRQIADLLRTQLREGDVLARLGGDEFGLLLRSCDVKAAAIVAQKLCHELESFSFEWEGKTFSVSCSIGVVPVDADTTELDAVLRSADIACYLAKEQGRNRVHITDSDDKQVVKRRGEMEWMTRIRGALEEERFYLDAQRIVPLLQAEPLRFEVLIRLIDEQGESVAPGAFLPPAERFGAAHRIDRWVIGQVCQQLADNRSQMDRISACHVNVSGRSFDRPDFQAFVLETLRYHNVPPDRLCFEITETAAIRNLGDALRFMAALKEEGCSFALDDFGSGLSSFGYLRRLPVDYLKIDGAFVRDIVADEADLAIVRAISEIGQTMNKRIIAEFVESDSARALLAGMGVHYGQGFGLHYPERLETVLTSFRKGE